MLFETGFSVAGDPFCCIKIQYQVWLFTYLILLLLVYSRILNLPLCSMAISSHYVAVLWNCIIAFLTFNEPAFKNLYQYVFFHNFLMSSADSVSIYAYLCWLTVLKAEDLHQSPTPQTLSLWSMPLCFL